MEWVFSNLLVAMGAFLVSLPCFCLIIHFVRERDSDWFVPIAVILVSAGILIGVAVVAHRFDEDSLLGFYAAYIISFIFSYNYAGKD